MSQSEFEICAAEALRTTQAIGKNLTGWRGERNG
jgi:hypothetical protein